MSNYFLHRYEQMSGDRSEDVFVVPSRNVLRINPLVASEKEVVSRLEGRGVELEPVKSVSLAYEYSSSFSLGSTEEYLLGMYYLQELASQLPVVALEQVVSRMGLSWSSLSVLDMCAAPGSKTTQLAAVMNNAGLLVALDVSRSRAEALANNCERCCVSNAQVYHKDALFAGDLGLVFDVVLLDAPCCGNFCLEEGWFDKRQVTDSSEMAREQRKFLEVALSVLRPGGLLVYSTCSLEVEENEGVLESLPSSAKILPISLSLGSPALSSWRKKVFRKDMRNATRLWPHRDGTQGFFLAVIQK
ncbi:MAG: NOL1/NOP2/sun family putative RNA methylase [Candidatus Woesearchaeota archaeon]